MPTKADHNRTHLFIVHSSHLKLSGIAGIANMLRQFSFTDFSTRPLAGCHAGRIVTSPIQT